jgi:hypothetical protein
MNLGAGAAMDGWERNTQRSKIAYIEEAQEGAGE